MSVATETWFRFTMPDGSAVTGPVHGSGGAVSARCSEAMRRILHQQKRARDGRNLSWFEPLRGHVSVHTGYSLQGSSVDQPRVSVDLRIAEIEVVAEPGEERP